ncbi:MAG: NUDIX domain-containing protein [Alphaproteobacteria bacterium]|nr:NUDIX domain-containing protein [Alphaproteobacteria bacterium]
MSAFPPSPPFETRIPVGEDRERQVCRDCGYIAYVNPKVVVGSVVVFGDKILLCRRAINPRRGFWTLPAGFLEEGETVEAGARREAMEEACADIVIDGLLACYSVPHISQVQLMFRAHLDAPTFAVGPESEAVALVDWADIPWPELAFPSVKWALDHYEAWRGGAVGPFTNPA